MIQQQTILKVSDNSGAKTVKCIKVLGGFKKKYATIGDIIVVSIQRLRNSSKKTSKVLKGMVFKAVIIKAKARYKKKDGSIYNLPNNSAILLNKKGTMIGTRILAPVPRKIKKKKFMKITSLSTGII